MISGNLTEIATLLWAPHTITTAVGYIAHMFHMLSLGHLFPVLDLLALFWRGYTTARLYEVDPVIHERHPPHAFRKLTVSPMSLRSCLAVLSQVSARVFEVENA